ASGKAGWDALFPPAVAGFRKVPLGDLGAVADAITPRTVAVMLEPIQGEAGVFEAGDDFLPALRALTAERGILLIVDEIQTGRRPTGRFRAPGAFSPAAAPSAGGARDPPDRRRDPDRRWPPRPLLRLPARRHRARH